MKAFRALSTVGLVVLLHAGIPADAQSVRQITDIRTDDLAGYAIDDRSTAVWAVTSADPFGTNPEHEYQVVRWTSAGVGSQATTIGGLARSVSVSDDGQWMAFVSRGDPLGQNADRSLELFVQSTDGATIRQLTHDPGPRSGRVETAMISGSGNRVVFVSNSDLLGTNADNVDQLYVVDTDGSGLGQPFVATSAATFGGLAVSDDGVRIVFAYTGNPTGANPDRISQVFRVEAGGSGLLQLSSFAEPSDQPAISGFGQVVAYRVGGLTLHKVNWDTNGALELGFGSGPSLTDDGSAVYYTATDGTNTEIFRRPTSGGPATQLTFTAYPAFHDRPVVSGGNGRVVFTASPAVQGGHYQLKVMDADGTDVEPLVEIAPARGSWLPDITPDGSRIVFLSDLSGDLFRVQADGTDRVQLTSGAEVWLPSISGDGQTVVFLSYDDLTGEFCSDGGKVFKIAADGSGLTRLSGCHSYSDFPVISRDGSTVVFQLGDTLYAVPPSGGEPTPFVDDGVALRKSPRISHDGAWVVYQTEANVAPYTIDVYRARTDGSFVERITDFPYRAEQPRPDLSGDGGRIVYAFGYDVFLYEPANGETRQLTSGGFNRDPRISGDGRFVYFRSAKASLQPMAGPHEDLFRMRIDTGEIERATGIPEPRGRVPAVPLGAPYLSAHFAVDQVGGAVFAFAFNSTLENPDLNVELFRVDFESPPRIEVGAGDPTALRWDADPGATTYDAIRGDLSGVGPGPGSTVDLGPVVCLADDSGAPYAEDAGQPSPGQAFFYLVRAGSGDWGSGTGGAVRVAGPGDCLP